MQRLPYLYQLQGVHAMHRYKNPEGNIRVLCSASMGLGKTFMSLLVAMKHPNWRPIIVVCPASIKHQWLHEITMALGERAEILSTRKCRKGKIDMTAPIVVINYDILRDWMPFLLKLKAKLLIVDESHYAASRSSIRTRQIKKLAKAVPNMIALSGTPLTNRPSELWPILHCLRPDLYPSFMPFAWNYCAPKKNFMGFWQYNGAANLGILHRRLKQNAMVRIRREDVIAQLPKKQRIVLPVDLSKRSEYDRATSDFMGWLGDVSPERLSSASRAVGFAKAEALKQLSAKLKMPTVLEWIDDFLQESEGKLIVFGTHRKVVGTIHERYGNSVLVNGSVTGDKRNLAVRKFQTDPKCRLLVGNIQAAGVGLNLTAADTVLFVELGWKPGEHSQAEDRCYARIGDLHGATIFYLVGRDTIEEELCRMIQRKQKVISAVLDDGKTDKDFDLFDALCVSLKRKMKVAA